MNVFQIIPVLDLGGAETMCENLSRSLVELGNDVTVVSFYTKETPITKRLNQDGIRIIYMNKKRGLDPLLLINLIKLLKEEKPDVVHSHIYALKYVALASLISGIKVRVHTVHNIAKKESGKISRMFNNLFFRSFFHVVPVAISPLIKESIAKEYHIKYIPVVYNGIDLSKCIPKESYEIDQTFKILHIGRFAEQKNHMCLLEAVSELRNSHEKIKLFLIGDGPLKQKAQEFVHEKQMDDTVVFLGLQDNVFPFLNAADVFTFPSIYEGMPMTLIEAMGTGLPIIASDVGGIPDMLVDQESALLIKPGVSQLVSTLDELIKNLDLRTCLGQRALEQSKMFSSEKMAEDYKRVYEFYN